MNIFITTSGNGSRLKQISPIDKHLLYFLDKKIIDWIKFIIPTAVELGNKKTEHRKETLTQIKDLSNVLIIDCDIIPFKIDLSKINTKKDNLFVFRSNKNKYGSVVVSSNIMTNCDENENISDTKCSGVYYIRNMRSTISKMTNNNSIASGMIGANIIYEDTFLRLGDIEDYMFSIINYYDYSCRF
jgi:hypothetical protein